MKNYSCFSWSIKLLFLFSMTGLFLCSASQLPAQESKEEIYGKWLIESCGDEFVGGSIHFKKGGTYTFNKTFIDGTGAELSGGYIFNEEANPAKLKLCLGDCGGEGTEWTTSFCIVRLNPEGKLEMYISAGQEFPSVFPSDQTEPGMYVFVRDK